MSKYKYTIIEKFNYLFLSNLIEILIISDKEKENFTFYSNDFKDFTKKLHDICNWSQLDNVAIEYHDLQETIYIHYKELFHIKSMISDYLKHIQNVEFIGINFDIPEYCVISLILG